MELNIIIFRIKNSRPWKNGPDGEDTSKTPGSEGGDEGEASAFLAKTIEVFQTFMETCEMNLILGKFVVCDLRKEKFSIGRRGRGAREEFAVVGNKRNECSFTYIRASALSTRQQGLLEQ